MIQITVTGNIGKDAETRDAGSERVTAFSVASTKKQKGADVTTWITCSIWGKRGEALSQYLTKGTPVTVVGELTEREYTKDGEKRKALECRVHDVALQGGKRADGADQQRYGSTGHGASAKHTGGRDDDSSVPF